MKRKYKYDEKKTICEEIYFIFCFQVTEKKQNAVTKDADYAF